MKIAQHGKMTAWPVLILPVLGSLNAFEGLGLCGSDVAVVIGAVALSNVSEALSATTGMRAACRSSTYVLTLWSGIAFGTAAMTALAFYLLGDLGSHLTAILKALGAGAIIAMAAETMAPEAFHNGPRYSGLLAASGFAALLLLSKMGFHAYNNAVLIQQKQ